MVRKNWEKDDRGRYRIVSTLRRPVYPFAEWVMLNRRRLGWTQSELAKEAGVSRITINKIENGFSPSEDTLKKIKKALDPPEGRYEKFIAPVNVAIPPKTPKRRKKR